jgi:magnesium transporter
LEIIRYAPELLDEFHSLKVEDLKDLFTKNITLWINIEGNDPELLASLSEFFQLHPLLQENMSDFTQSPRLEEFDDHIFLTLKMLSNESATGKIVVEHLNIIIGENYLITIQEGLEGDVFHPIREKLNRMKSRLRVKGSDYLAYAVLDVIIDNYIMIIESFGERIEELEKQFLNTDQKDPLKEIYDYKLQINFLRKTIRPVREVAVLLEKSDSEIINASTIPYYNSLVNHMAHSTEAIETYQIMLNDQLYLYQTRVSNKLNEILRTLTIFSVIFIPLTFIAGVYGTNFKFLPELSYKYSYAIFWGVLIVIAGGMLVYFKRKRWM